MFYAATAHNETRVVFWTTHEARVEKYINALNTGRTVNLFHAVELGEGPEHEDECDGNNFDDIPGDGDEYFDAWLEAMKRRVAAEFGIHNPAVIPAHWCIEVEYTRSVISTVSLSVDIPKQLLFDALTYVPLLDAHGRVEGVTIQDWEDFLQEFVEENIEDLIKEGDEEDGDTVTQYDDIVVVNS